LAYILLIIRDKDLVFISTDLEVELCGMVQTENAIEKPVEITLPGKKILDICRMLPENSLVELTEDNGKVTVRSGKSRFVLTSLPAKEYPKTQTQEKMLEFRLTQRALKKIIETTAFAIPQQDMRQYLNGLLVEVKDGSIQCLATDGHRLAMNSTALSVVDSSFAQVIIPRKGVFELLRLLENSDEEIVLNFNNNAISVKSNNFVLTSKLISGRFPNYNKIIPKRGSKCVEINRQELKQAMTRVGIVSTELFHSVKFQLRPDLLILMSNNPGQEEAVEELTANYQGDNLNTVFNVGYFVDILNALGTEKISISFRDSENGVIIEEVNGDTNCLYVLMPIRQ
jgi:DNA polymerase III subunit beta